VPCILWDWYFASVIIGTLGAGIDTVLIGHDLYIFQTFLPIKGFLASVIVVVWLLLVVARMSF